MIFLKKHTVLRLFIIFLMISLTLPCSAKQDFKKALNIPTLENIEKPNKTTTCQTLIETTSQKKNVIEQKGENNNYFLIFYPFILPFITIQQKSEQPQSITVPIFILHEQYRL